MKSAFNRSILALAAILVVAGASQANAQQKGLKKYESGTKEFWTHPPDDWFLGDETEAQKGLAPPSGPPTGSSDAELAAMMKKIKLPAGFKIEVYASNVLAARQMADFGGIVCFLAPSAEEAAAVVGRTRIWKLAESLGGVESLIEVPAAMTHASTADAPFASPPNLVRLSVGIESADDLVADLESALVRSAAPA